MDVPAGRQPASSRRCSLSGASAGERLAYHPLTPAPPRAAPPLPPPPLHSSRPHCCACPYTAPRALSASSLCGASTLLASSIASPGAPDPTHNDICTVTLQGVATSWCPTRRYRWTGVQPPGGSGRACVAPSSRQGARAASNARAAGFRLFTITLPMCASPGQEPPSPPEGMNTACSRLNARPNTF